MPASTKTRGTRRRVRKGTTRSTAHRPGRRGRNGTARPVSRSRSSADRDDAVFKAIANADRRSILDAIRNGAMTTGELCDHLDHLDRCTVMLHLTVLEEAGLIIARRDGRKRWNHLDIAPIQAIYARWIEPYAAPAAGLLLRLKRELEGDP